MAGEGEGKSPGTPGHVDASPAVGRRQVQSMSEVPWMGSLQELLYFTAQSSFSSSAAATQICPKLSQYVSQRPPFDSCTYTKAVQVLPHVTPWSTRGQALYDAQQSSGSAGTAAVELVEGACVIGA